MPLTRPRLFALALYLLAAVVTLLAARDMANRGAPGPLVAGFAVALYAALHQCLAPFTTTTDKNGTHTRG